MIDTRDLKQTERHQICVVHFGRTRGLMDPWTLLGPDLDLWIDVHTSPGPHAPNSHRASFRRCRPLDYLAGQTVDPASGLRLVRIFYRLDPFPIPYEYGTQGATFHDCWRPGTRYGASASAARRRGGQQLIDSLYTKLQARLARCLSKTRAKQE